MSEWTSGYVADIDYTYGYYPELNPLRTRLAFLHAGLIPPQVGYCCELGFGQGMSANVHAAGSTAEWWGTDFNPAQAGFAYELAGISRANAKFFDQAFAEFCQRGDLPEFDYIGLHGIWSWISDENRAAIVDFVRRKLKIGGVLYISYNTMPGWASFAPMRHLMTQHAEVMAAPGAGIVSRINSALEFTEKMLATNPNYLRANPTAAERLKKIKEQNRNYLAHEYFNRDWAPMPFADMARWLEPAKLNFACSATYLDHVDGINLSPEQQSFLKEIPDALFRETTRDFMVNQQFRKDYWVKGARRFTVLGQIEALRQGRYMLVMPKADVTLTITGSLGEAKMQEEVYLPILEALADHQPKSLVQIEQTVNAKAANVATVDSASQPKIISPAQIVQATLVLAGAGNLAAVQDDATILKARKQTDRLNAHLIDLARSSGEISILASPVTGGGYQVGRFQQLFLLARTQGRKQPAEWAQFAWQTLVSQGQKIIKQGSMLETPEENIAELNAEAETLAQKQLPILKALQII